MSLRALVTGGNGIVGQALCETLRLTGWNVSVFSRNLPDEELKSGICHIKGSITDPDSIQSAVRGHNVVFHLAAEPLNRNLFDSVNVQGTQNVVDACRNAGVGHLVYTSTTAALDAEGFIHDRINEQAVRARLRDIDGSHAGLSPYGVSKAKGQKIVSDARSEDFRAVSLVVPQVVTKSNARLKTFLQKSADGIVPEPGNHLFDWVGVHDLAQAHFSAAKALLAGATLDDFYIVTSGQPQPYIGFMNGLLEALGLTQMTLVAPEVAVQRLSPGALKKMSESRHYDITAARRDLRFLPRETFAEVCLSFRQS